MKERKKAFYFTLCSAMIGLAILFGFDSIIGAASYIGLMKDASTNECPQAVNFTGTFEIDSEQSYAYTSAEKTKLGYISLSSAIDLDSIDSAHIQSIDASQVEGGPFDVSVIPDLTSSKITDFDTAVSANSDVTANTAKVGLPDQSGNSGKYLTTDASTPSWTDLYFSNLLGENSYNFGAGSDTDIVLYANNGDATLPAIKYDSATDKWQYRNNAEDGYLDIGSGSGVSGDPLRLNEMLTLDSSATSVYVNPSDTTTELNNIIVHNTDTSPVTFTAWYCPGGAAQVDTMKFIEVSLPANETAIFELEKCGIVFSDENDTIKAMGSVPDKLNVVASGVTNGGNVRLTSIMSVDSSSSGTSVLSTTGTDKYAKTMIVHNTNTATETFQLWCCKDGEAAVDTNRIMHVGISAGDTLFFDMAKYGIPLMDNGDALKASGSTTGKVTVQIYGSEE